MCSFFCPFFCSLRFFFHVLKKKKTGKKKMKRNASKRHARYARQRPTKQSFPVCKVNLATLQVAIMLTPRPVRKVARSTACAKSRRFYRQRNSNSSIGPSYVVTPATQVSEASLLFLHTKKTCTVRTFEQCSTLLAASRQEAQPKKQLQLHFQHNVG